MSATRSAGCGSIIRTMFICPSESTTIMVPLGSSYRRTREMTPATRIAASSRPSVSVVAGRMGSRLPLGAQRRPNSTGVVDRRFVAEVDEHDLVVGDEPELVGR